MVNAAMKCVVVVGAVVALAAVVAAGNEEERGLTIRGLESPFSVGEAEELTMRRFEAWAKDLEREYAHEEEKMSRFAIFKENMEYATKANEVRACMPLPGSTRGPRPEERNPLSLSLPILDMVSAQYAITPSISSFKNIYIYIYAT